MVWCVQSVNRRLFANKEVMLSKTWQGLWHISGESVHWSFPLCTVVLQLEFSGFGKLTQKPGIEVIFTLALRSGALCCKGSPHARVRNAVAAIFNHLNAARCKGQASKEIPTPKGQILFSIALTWKRTNSFEVETPKIIRGTIPKPHSVNCTNVSVLGVYWTPSNVLLNTNSRHGKPKTILKLPFSKGNSRPSLGVFGQACLSVWLSACYLGRSWCLERHKPRKQDACWWISHL